MSFDFPSPASEGQFYTPLNGPQYVYVNGAWRMAGAPTVVATAETRNRIVNGAMQISQEVGLDVSTGTTGSYPADQWQFVFATSGTPAATAMFDVEGNMLRIMAGATPDTSIAAGDLVHFLQKIEGKRVTDFQWGTANAKPVVLRFAGRANIASMVIGVAVRNAASNRSFVKNVTLTPTWQDFSIAIPGDTTGTWPVDTGPSVFVSFTGMVGSTYTGASENTWLATNSIAGPGVGNIMSAANQAMYIKNVSLHLDPLATGIAPPWQMPDEAEELRACQRYYRKIGPVAAGSAFGAAFSSSAVLARALVQVSTPMRSNPAVTLSAVGDFVVATSAAFVPSALSGVSIGGGEVVDLAFTISGATAGQGGYLRSGTANAAVFLNSRM